MYGLGEGLEEGEVELVAPPAVEQDVEPVHGDQVRQRRLPVHAGERRQQHRRPHRRRPASGGLGIWKGRRRGESGLSRVGHRVSLKLGVKLFFSK